MIKVVSLLGVGCAGKSTLALGLRDRLAYEGIEADIIKKDDAFKAVGQERYGEKDTTSGYSILGTLQHGRIPSIELHRQMNREIKSSLDLGHIAILEGGTRTRTAQAESLAGLNLADDELRIFVLQLPFREVVRRAHQRRKESGRYDDRLPVMAIKMAGMYRGMRSSDAPQVGDPDVLPLDATLPRDEQVEIVANEIFESQSERP